MLDLMPGMETQARDATLREYVEIIRRRRLTLLYTFIAVATVGFVSTLLTRPVFLSTARIAVEDKPLAGGGMGESNMSDALEQLAMNTESHDVPTQMEVLTGYVILTKAADESNIPHNAAIDGKVAVSVKRIKDTDVLEIDAESHNKMWAYAMAKKIPDTYSRYVKAQRTQEISNALNYATTLLKTERAELEVQNAKFEKFKVATNVPSLDTQVQAEVADAVDAQTDVRKAEAQVAGDEARLRDMLKTRGQVNPNQVIPTVMTTNDRSNALKDQLEGYKTERERLLVMYEPSHAEVQKIDAQIKSVETRIAALPRTETTVTRQPNPEVAALDDRIGEARAALASDSASMDNARLKAAQVSTALRKFSPLEREQAELLANIEEHRGRVDELIGSVDQLSVKEKAVHEPVLIVWPALTATKVAPRIGMNMIVSCILGLMLGIGLVMLQEYVDDRISSPEAARNLLGAPALGYVPLVTDGSNPILDGNSAGFMLESYRVLRSNVQFATVDIPKLTLLVTSTVPSEGKSVTAANLAVALALDGRRVILVDTDLRRPTLHDKFGLKKLPGLTDVLRGTAGIDSALQQTSVPGLRLMPAGPFPPNPAELLNSHAMRQLHEAMKQEADIVIYDSPPCLATADAQVMSAMVDGVLYVMQFGVAKKSAVMHAFELLRQAHANVLGVVFNKIDLSSKRSNYYGYYGYYGYYEYYRRYTTQTPEADAVEGDNEAVVGKLETRSDAAVNGNKEA